MTKSILSIWGLSPVNEVLLSTSLNKKKNDGEQIFGVELEIERTEGMSNHDAFMNKEDGSLRNNGMEFVSFPMRHSNLVGHLHEFFSRNPHLGENNYSERTSVHVHANVQDMTLPQLGNLLLLYQVFEELLFNFVGADRAKNIFCVPLSECATSYRAAVDLQLGEHRVISRWSKYTSLNLLPIRDIGTVEFRHMHGTNDMVKLTAWLNLLNCLLTAAKSYSFQEIYSRVNELNTNSQFKMFGGWVFGKHVQHLQCPEYDLMLERGILNAKWACIGVERLDKKLSNKSAWKPVEPERDPLRDALNILRQQAEAAMPRRNIPAPAGFVWMDEAVVRQEGEPMPVRAAQ